MGKRVLALVVGLIVAGALPAGAGKARAVEERYNQIEVDTSGARGRLGSVTFETYEGERSVSVEVVDDAGQVVAFDVQQGRRSNSVEIDGCGRTERPVAIRGGKPVTVSFVHEFGPPGSGECEFGMPTQGTIRATFTR